ncbi:MAG: DNA replication/repair protein RecF [Sphingobacteriales bacterium]|nr:MAG: DNA replication/repair protein RecF [Sphingobacteriales bacterium]TAF81694.1 MAG: DNA replication/repair protein RecF [Sphingobacteriales bacterium]
MHLKTLSLINFKNYDEGELSFSDTVNVFTGNNGAGKTNLLDAIHYLSLCKSYFNPIDSQQIKHDKDFFVLQGKFQKNNAEEIIAVGVKKNQKKQFKRNKKEYPRLADHIGLLPLVMISPNDISLILEGSEERRKFIDNALSQTDNYYLDELILYNKTLQNRNALLKHIAERGNFDASLLEVFDEQLVACGTKIFEKRKAFIEVFMPVFNKHYQYISHQTEVVELVYESQLFTGSFKNLLRNSLQRDRTLQRTTTGIHKDELVFTIGRMPLKKFGSQGQQKSFLIALKLAQYSILFDLKGFKPMLLLDDIFDKLDEQRIKKLMTMVSNEDFGQIFITDTNTSRIKFIFNEIGKTPQIFEIDNGKVNEQNER